MSLRVSDVAERTGLSADTVRYYERVGLLPNVERSTNGYRSYDETSIHRLRFIKGAQRFGLRLTEIRELLEVQDRGLCPCGHTGELLSRRILEVNQEIERLTQLRGDLQSMVEQADRCPEPMPASWECSVEFISGGGDLLEPL
jgi:DNA-binding transcriptional MerR regulator